MTRPLPAIPHPSAALVGTDDRVTREWLTPYFERMLDRLPRVGTASFAGGGPTTVAVTLSPAEKDTSYLVYIENVANRNHWVTSKTTTGFTLNQSATAAETVGWALMRF